MKPSTTLFLTALIGTTPLLASGWQQQQIGLRVEYYEVDHLTANELVTAPTDQTDATGIRKQLLAKVALDEARLVDSTYVVTRSGQRAKNESIVELIYPTEYDPPELPQKLTGPISSATNVVTPATPTALETRNVGLTFEVDPVIGSDGVTVDLNLAPEFVTYVGDITFGRSEATLEQPVFHSVRDSTALTMRSGTWALLGVHNLPPKKPGAAPPADRRLLSLVKTSVIFVGSEDTNVDSALQTLRDWAETLPHEHAEKTVDDGFLALLYDEFGRHIAPPLKKRLREQGLKIIAEAFKNAPKDPPPKRTVIDDPFADEPDGFGPGDVEQNHVPKQIAIHYHWYQLNALAATKLLDKHGGPFSDATPLREHLDSLVAKKRATLVESAYVVTRSGQRAKSESVREWIYPTEMDPPEIPQELTGPVDPGAKIITHTSNTAFETRHVGPTLEVDPVYGPDDLTIDLNLAAEIVRHGADRPIGQREARGVQPIFYTIKDNTATTLHSGTSVLIGMHTPMPEDVLGRNVGSDQRILTIATARLIKAE